MRMYQCLNLPPTLAKSLLYKVCYLSVALYYLMELLERSLLLQRRQHHHRRHLKYTSMFLIISGPILYKQDNDNHTFTTQRTKYLFRYSYHSLVNYT